MTSNTSRNFEIWVEKNMRVELKKKKLESRKRERSPVVLSINRDLKIRGRRQQRKRRWKSEFVFFQSSSRLLQVTSFSKFRRTILKLNS